MKIKVDVAELRESHWYQYLVRFAFGGAVTALAGEIAKRFGPEVGGLFLAFPAILPAAATLIAKHEREKKEQAGMQGILRARKAAGVDAIGASMGALGLIAFAIVVWRALSHWSLAGVLLTATSVWLATSVTVWLLCENLRHHGAHRVSSSPKMRAPISTKSQ